MTFILLFWWFTCQKYYQTSFIYMWFVFSDSILLYSLIIVKYSLFSQALFSDDEDCSPGHLNKTDDVDDLTAIFNSSANQSGVFGSHDTSLPNQSGVFGSRDTSFANQSSLFVSQTPGTPLILKEVNNKFNIMRISGSPVKSPKMLPGFYFSHLQSSI